MRFALLSLGFLLSVAMAGAGCPSAPSSVTGGVAFSSSQTLQVGSSVKFVDGLEVRLTQVNDSRCKPGVQCIWQGELSPVFVFSGGKMGTSTSEVMLGTERARSLDLSNGFYHIDLEQATEDSATIQVKEINK